MYDFEIVNDNGTIDCISCRNRSEAIETYCLIHGCSKEYVKEHCIIRKTFLPSSAGWSKMRELANSYKMLYDTLKKERIELINGISVAKEKQAKKILDEVERMILDNTYPDFDVKHKPINVWRAQEGYDALAEIKKKYTGGGSDKCCEDCKFFNTYRKDQPCCSCYDYINFESDVEGEP